MAESAFQHEMTLFRVGAYALGGKEAQGRVPDGKPPREMTEEEKVAASRVELAKFGKLQGLVKQMAQQGAAVVPPRSGKSTAQNPADALASLKSQMSKLPKPGGDK